MLQFSDTLERERRMEMEHASLQEVLLAVKQAEQKRCSRNVAKRLGPLIDFIDRYAKAVDVIVQGTVSPVTLAWGLLRSLIEVSSILISSLYYKWLISIGGRGIHKIFSKAYCNARNSRRYVVPLFGVRKADARGYPLPDCT